MKRAYLLVEVSGVDEYVEAKVREVLSLTLASVACNLGNPQKNLRALDVSVELCDTDQSEEIVRLRSQRTKTKSEMVHSEVDLIPAEVQ